MDLAHGLSGLLVGVLVGMTGVGGGSLMAPILILLLGVSPATAVGTDLWFAAITKSVGGAVHHSLGEPDWTVVRRLALGSIPASIVTSLLLAQIDTGQIKHGLIISALGVILIATAVATLSWGRVQGLVLRMDAPMAAAYRQRQPAFTVLAGVLLGVMVTLTSIGAGALGAVMLMALYPVRMTARRLVGTDIVHAVPLTIVAGLGHLVMGNVDFPLLGSLLVGSIPGIIIGSLLATRLSAGVLRPVLALVLAATGMKMIFS
ncbi:MAG: sulfite exporter TauE/SafE family protein [Sphingomonas sp.]|nr:sulfite exporter TauE/SafE family protein [Sphingomonas sp.]